MTKLSYLLVFLLVIAQPADAKRRSPKIELSPIVATKVEDVLDKANELRQALIERQDAAVISRTRAVERALTEALKISDPNKQTKEHLNRMLSETQKILAKYSTTQGEDRRQVLQDAFRQIVLIGQTYKTRTDDYKFYFCGRDRSVWLQKEGKPVNPINPDKHNNCATRVE